MQYVRLFLGFVSIAGAHFSVACAGSDETQGGVSPTTSGSGTAAPVTMASTSSGTASSTNSVATSLPDTSSATNNSSSGSPSNSTSANETTTVDTGPTFTADVHPILTSKCSGASCHSGDFFDKYAAADIDVAYQTASAEGDKLIMRTENGTMPMGVQCLEGGVWSTDPKCLTEAERALLQEWVNAGTPL